MKYQPIIIKREEDSEALYLEQQCRRRRSAAKAHARKVQVARQKRTLLFSVVAIVLGVILTFSVLGTNAKASDSNQATETYKYYKELYIESGDTLWGIAAEHTDGSVKEITSYIEEVREINSINKYETLKSGTYITVPYYSSEYLH